MPINKFIRISLLLFAVELVIAGGLSAQFTMTPTSYITIKQGSTLYVGSNLNIRGNSSSSAYFVDQTTTAGSVTITGNVSVERYLTSDEWHNVASPVAAANSSVYGTTWLTFYYDETYIQNDWMFGWFDFSGPLNVMRGYDVFIENSPLLVTYTGSGNQLNTGTYSFGVTNSTFVVEEPPARKGWNLAGNPYPSPIDWQFSAGWNKGPINDAKYIWDGTIDNYTIWIGGGAPIGINGGTQYIPSNQGFWVQAISNGNIQVNNQCRIGTIPATPDFYKNSDNVYPMLDLLAEGEKYKDETIIRFIEGTSTGFDWNYDASKLLSFEENVPQISTVCGKFDVLAINSLPELHDELAVGLNFQSSSNGNFTIKLTNLTRLNEQTSVYLKDNFEQKIVNLSQDSVYSFYHQVTNNKSRFTVFFNPSADVINNITPEYFYSVYANDNEINIVKNTVKPFRAEVRIFNISGQLVYEDYLENEPKTSFRLLAPTGYYLLSIKTNESITNQKILITN